MEFPIDQVGSVEKRGGIDVDRVTWTAAGRQFTLLSGPGQVGEMSRALELKSAYRSRWLPTV